MTLEDLVEEESRKEEYSIYDDRKIVCSNCGNSLFFMILYPVPMNNATTSVYKYIPQNIEFTYECLYCKKEHTEFWLSKKAYVALNILSKYEIGNIDIDYLDAIKELEEYLA